MEDLEMKQALRRYVETSEPPFSLTAHALISQARRRHRWRVGLGIGGGGAATTLAIISTIALVPVMGGGAPTLGPGCDFQLPLGYRVLGSFSPNVPSGFPAPRPIDPALESSAGMSLNTSGPSKSPPTEPVTEQVTARLAPPVSGEPSQERLDEMSCFLKRRMVQLLPNATFAPHHNDPMEVTWESGTDSNGEPITVYRAGAYVVDGSLLCLINVMVFRGDLPHTAGLSHSGDLTTASVRTGSSTILITVEGKAIADGSAWAIANAPELDLYR